MTDNPYRLPRHVTPSRYEISLTPDLEHHTFVGSTIIAIDVHEATSTVILNAAELAISTATFSNDAGASVSAHIVTDEETERLTLTTSATLAQGRWNLDLEFAGILNDELRGFYRASFTDVDGNEQTIATTQFEATDARRAFPCWDEPDLKAVFSISLTVPSDLLAVSNGAEAGRHDNGDGTTTVQFADTMIMSTYIVAFVVGPLEATDPIDVDGVPFRVIAPIGKGYLTDFASEAGVFCLRWLSNYYGIPYPGDKVDFIAVPDFAFGAMENLGAIIYRETALLLDRDTTSLAEQRRVVDVIAHELAHMWFGDLVTMRWWEGIWLNEAFASLMEMKTTEAMHPDWERWMAFAADPGAERSDALTIDALAESRSVEFPVASPDEANEMFDALTYGKGSAVLRMIEQFLGGDHFRLGVADYLRTHSYGNTVTNDLWAALDRASGMPVGDIMNTWILQPGHPLIDVNIDGNRVHLSQRRMLLQADETDTSLWSVPMQIKASIDGEVVTQKFLLESDSAIVEFPGPVDWVLGNGGGHGFYRVNYPDRELHALMGDIESLEPLERLTLLDDVRATVVAGQNHAAAYLELCDHYRNETQQAVWQLLLGGLKEIKDIISNEQLPGFEKRVRSIVAKRASEVGWEPIDGETDLNNLLRGDLIRAMGNLGNDPETVAMARPFAEQLLDDPASVDPVVGQASLFVLAAHGTDKDFVRLREAYDDAPTPQLRQRYLQALCSFDDERFVKQVFDWTFDETIRGQDAAWVVARMLSNRESGPEVWKMVRSGWNDILAAYPQVTVRHLFDGLPSLSYPEVAADVEAFFAETEVRSAKTLAQMLEILRVHVALRQRESGRIGDALPV